MVEIESYDGATATLTAVVDIAGASVTPPSTSTIGPRHGSAGWAAIVGLALMLVVAAMGAAAMFRAPIALQRRR